jgi:transketolase
MKKRSSSRRPSGPAAFGQQDDLCINTIRALAMDMVQKANSGHPGAPMGLAPLAYLLWTRHLRHNPRDPAWPGRDRFVLSAGHASALQYALLHLTGYDLSLEELRRFRQWESLTPGHPELGETPGVGPGHPIIDHQILVVASDGDLMEGVSAEAASLAGFLRLANLAVFYDDNRITIEGSTDLTFREDVPARFKGYGWRVLTVEDGNGDLAALDAAIKRARAEKERPTLVIVKTHIGFGSPNKQDSAAAHGAPLGEEEVRLTKRNLGWPESPAFLIPEEALKIFREAVPRGEAAQDAWRKRMAAYRRAHPDLAAALESALQGDLPAAWDADLPRYAPGSPPVATRSASGKALNAIAARVPTLLGGSADLAPSNNTLIEGAENFSAERPGGRILRFGIREHAMAAALNGMAAHGGVRPFGGTFLVFADYMRPSIRLAAMQRLPTLYVFTHDSIGVGEDGPTHQPVEHLATLRAIPDLAVVRPADANEAVAAWRETVARGGGPVALVLTRQKVPVLEGTEMLSAAGVVQGAYVLADADPIDALVMASGSEVQLALGARAKLAQEGIGVRVVSFPCWEWFEAQGTAVREQVLPSAVTRRLAVEAASPFGWERWAGPGGSILGVSRFGVSAPAAENLEKFGFTVEHVAARVRALMRA